MIDIQINSTATNLASTLIAASVGWALATVSGAIKSALAEAKLTRRSAATVRSELATNLNIVHGWGGTLEVLASRPTAISRTRLVPMQVGALEATCLNGTFDQIGGGIGDWLRGVLVAARSANAACLDLNSQQRVDDATSLVTQLPALKAYLRVAIEELDRLQKRGWNRHKPRKIEELNTRLTELLTSTAA